ncbi:MAG: photosystem II biogenesis protein Psp29 [Synechococcaceae cyanobacterium SM2_3_60]|nr:photosystem II biogenesis protein Psp29 [Synechococcaceae cyanobacterium SM2_3_60]
MNTVRSVADTKATFFATYQRPISSLYRRVVEELLVETHLNVVNKRFTYDPFFALGMTVAFDSFTQGYAPEDQTPLIFAALCQALELNPDVIRGDAAKMRAVMTQGDREARLHLLQLAEGAEDTEGLRSILESIRDNPDFRYTRTFLLGLYAAYEATAPESKEDQPFMEIAASLNLPLDAVKKILTSIAAVLKSFAKLAK